MISEKLRALILSELHLADGALNDDTTAAQVPGWDSLNHVRILSAIEKAYGIRFRSLEVIRLKTVGDLQQLIDRKTTERPR
jgi:acyl carrier protein